MPMSQGERHYVHRTGWLRAAVLGANDGIVSTASLVLGVAASHATQQSVLIAGVAGLAAGAMSMAAGEYVSVSSQEATERADIAREERELARRPEAEHRELAAIYEKRGLDAALASRVAEQLIDSVPVRYLLLDENVYRRYTAHLVNSNSDQWKCTWRGVEDRVRIYERSDIDQ